MISHPDKPFLIAGAGVSGATLARVLAENGLRCIVIDERRHVAGNCHTEPDAATGIMIHRYGPHIFHTDNDRVWDFASRFTDFVPYRHQVFSVAGGRIYSLPINLLTINQFFGRVFSTAEAEAFVRARCAAITAPANFEEQALSTIGPELYEAFFRGYTLKQWGRDPKTLPASLLKRLPLRFTYDSNYFRHARQAMPRHGYTAMVENMLRHPNIEVRLGLAFSPELAHAARHCFYTGPLDRYFDFRLGRLAYRTLDFEEIRVRGTLQGTSVVNYGDTDVKWTRITEHKHLSPWQETGAAESVCFREYSRDCQPGDIPYYPIGLAAEQSLLKAYAGLAESSAGVSFLGRLGSYAYLDMDAAIERALDAAERSVALLRSGQRLPAFFHPVHG